MLTFPESRRFHVLTILILVGSFSVGIAKIAKVHGVKYNALTCRKHSASLTDFGGVGDGKTLNTKAFQAAIANLSQYANDGGAELVVPAGKWLTGSFNLTSHFTLFLHKDATILASQNEADYPFTAPLPSFGIEKKYTNGRFTSLIHGTNLTDVVITGNNGTIDGQGAPWWDKFANGTMTAWRPFLIELMYTTNLQISSITLLNAPFWNIHPVYSSNITIQSVTIIAPVDIPNTDGINPNSCSNVRIEDCYIVSGDDCIAVKSGWDQYGIKFGMPTKDVVIRRLTCSSPDSAVVALGSEMSGGIQNVRIEDITGINTQSGIRIKTAPGRGGYVKDIFARRMTYSTVPKYIFWVSGGYKGHPDEGYDPNALAEITNINFRDVVAENVTKAASLNGFAGHPFTGICVSNTTIKSLFEDARILQWNCTDVQGILSNVAISQYPCLKPCSLLTEKPNTVCAFPEDKLPIESVQLNTCSVNTGV